MPGSPLRPWSPTAGSHGYLCICLNTTRDTPPAQDPGTVSPYPGLCSTCPNSGCPEPYILTPEGTQGPSLAMLPTWADQPSVISHRPNLLSPAATRENQVKLLLINIFKPNIPKILINIRTTMTKQNMKLGVLHSTSNVASGHWPGWRSPENVAS